MNDVVVVGGGPAGAATAIVCARAGLDVVLLERHPCCVDKPGETLHPGVEPIFDKLGVGNAVRTAGFLRHDGIDIEWGGTRRDECYGEDDDGPWRGFQAWRPTLEEVLLEHAVACGASVRRGARVCGFDGGGRDGVTVETQAEVFRARWIVDASGGRHWLARLLGVGVQRLSPRLICRYGYVRGALARPTLRGDAAGWEWLAEVQPGICAWTRFALDGSTPSEEAPHGAAIGPTRAADVSWRWCPECAGPGYFMVGDAAAVLDPASSHGVLRALMTGMRSGSLIVAQRGDASLPAAHIYREWLGGWIRHDARHLHQAYRDLRRAPAVRPLETAASRAL